MADWHAEQWKLHQSSKEKENESFGLRYQAKTLISETDIKTQWNYCMNNHRLTDRFENFKNIVGIDQNDPAVEVVFQMKETSYNFFVFFI